MSIIQNTNVAFRCPNSLKDKLFDAADARNEDLSSYVRRACIEALRREDLEKYFGFRASIKLMTSNEGSGE